MKVLVVAETCDGKLASATLNAISAAIRLGGEIHLLVAGHDCAELAETCARISGVSRVLLADAPFCRDGLPETFAELIVSLAVDFGYIVAAATTFGKGLLPRVAARLDVAPVTDVVGIVSPDTFTRPIHAGSLLSTVRSCDPIRILTMRAMAFDAALPTGGKAAIEAVKANEGAARDRLLRALASSQRISRDHGSLHRLDITSARIVVAGGRGLGCAEDFKRLLEPLADKLGAAIGASRAAVDGGFIANQYQVGQTGRMVSPELYIAVGISGAIQHLAGMRESRVIVAINRDANAPICQAADYALVGDLFEIVPALTAAL